MKKATKKTAKKKKVSNSKLMFLSVILLFILVEALFILKSQIDPSLPQVAGISTSK